jgi:hypothetical protein
MNKATTNMNQHSSIHIRIILFVGLLAFSALSLADARLSSSSSSSSVSYEGKRQLEQFYNFEDEETEGSKGDWGDYEGDPLDPNPSSFAYDEGDDSTSKGDAQSSGSSQGKATTTTASNYAGGYSGSAATSSSTGGSKSTSSGGYTSSTSSTSSSTSQTSGGHEAYSTTSNSYSGGTDTSSKTTYVASSSSNPIDYGGYGVKQKKKSFKFPSLKYLNFKKAMSVKVPLIPALILFALCAYLLMLFTAYSYQNNPEGIFTNCCRLSVHTTTCLFKVYVFLQNQKLLVTAVFAWKNPLTSHIMFPFPTQRLQSLPLPTWRNPSHRHGHGGRG